MINSGKDIITPDIVAHAYVSLAALMLPGMLKETEAESGSRGFFSPSPHNTRHAGPHRAFDLNYRTVVG
jgi:hypothetical protein